MTIDQGHAGRPVTMRAAIGLVLLALATAAPAAIVSAAPAAIVTAAPAATISAAPAAISAAPATPADDLHRLIDEQWQAVLADYPTLATSLGDHRGDGKLSDQSLAAADARAARAAAFAARLDAIPDAGLADADRVNRAILRRQLGETIAENRYPERMMLFNSYASWPQNFAGLPDDQPFASRLDYRSYLDRLAGYRGYNQAAIAVSRRAVASGVVQPCETLAGFPASVTGLIVADPTGSRYFAPFLRARPGDVTPPEWAAMQAEAKALIRDVLDPENRATLAFFAAEYLPHCRRQPGAAALPRGAAWYAWRVTVETTTDMTPDQVHGLGLKEVARIRGEMDALAGKSGYPSRAAMIARMKTDPRFFAETPAALLAQAAFQAKTIDGKLPQFFGRLPRLPYGVRAIPAEIAPGTTTAYYSQGSPASGIAGTYYVNTAKLDQRPLWELPALTAHEAVPGHHNQIALQQELDLPPFRRHVTAFTAFTEGWALYAEHLGIEMGLYDTPEKDMGRLSYEMWRACRLVVDTGIHARGWTKARAVAFMADNSALTDANIDAEVNRYISWPGQALGYKLGELRIRALRARAEQALGPKFDLRRFHDAVLAQGSVPLDVLEAQIDRFIRGG